MSTHDGRVSVIRVLVAVGVLALLFGPFLVGHVKYSMDPLVINDDVRQWVFPFFRHTAKGTAASDIPGDYMLTLMPTGFKVLYRAFTPVLDPAALSKVLPYLLLLTTLLGVGMAGRVLRGPVAGLMAVILALQAPFFLREVMGGLPRSFAFPFIALGFAALVAGRARVLALLVVFAQAFYPVAAVVLGLMLFMLLFLVPRADRGDAIAWSVRERLTVLVVIGALATALFVPTAAATRRWGRLLGPGDGAIYPEVGPGGTWDERDMPRDKIPFPGLFVETSEQIVKSLDGDAGVPLVPSLRTVMEGRKLQVAAVLSMVLVLGSISLARREAAARRALVLPLAGAFTYVFARAMVPYLYMPPRYIQYSIPLFVVALLPAVGAGFAEQLSSARWVVHARGVGAGLVTAVVLLFIGGRGDPWSGHGLTLGSTPSIIQFLCRLPKDVLVAGWPSGEIENVPYFCRRRALVNEETDQVGHEGFVLEMRRRKHALIAALFGDDARALVELRDTFGVTHLIVDIGDFAQPPKYPAPTGAETARTWQRGNLHGFAVQGALAKAAVFRDGELAVLDLAKL